MFFRKEEEEKKTEALSFGRMSAVELRADGIKCTQS